MKKTYIAPVTEEIKLKNQISLLVNSITWDESGATDIVDAEDIIDTGGILDPDARELVLEDDFEFTDE